MLEVIEQTEGSRQLGETIRAKLLAKLAIDVGDSEDAFGLLRRLFNEIDKNGSNRLSRSEFELLMDRLEVSFSRKKWKQIYHEIDRNYDDEISFDEFFVFLFPNHELAAAQEVKRMKRIRHRVAQRSQKMLRFSFGRMINNDDAASQSPSVHPSPSRDLESPREKNIAGEIDLLRIGFAEEQARVNPTEVLSPETNAPDSVP